MLLCFDGVVHDGDLPVQAFARHITEQLPAEQIRPVIAGMRGFLEGRTELVPADIDLSTAEDGYQAVEILALAAGLDDAAILDARRASRADLAASAWSVDPADGLGALLSEVESAGAGVVLLTEPGDPAARPVLASIDVTVDEIVDAPVDLAVAQILRQLTPPGPDRLLVIGNCWTGQLESVHNQGCRTSLVDRYGRGRGTPTFRSADLTGLIDPVGKWLHGQSSR